MRNSRRVRAGALVALALAGSAPAWAQGLDQRVARSAGDVVQFHYAARPGVCGDGSVLLNGRWTGGGVDRWTGTASATIRRAVRWLSTRPPVHLSTLLLAAACASHTAAAKDDSCDASITLPPGFCALVFADTVGPARHIVVRSNGDVYVGIVDQRRVPGGVLALRDTNKDGHADLKERFGET